MNEISKNFPLRKVGKKAKKSTASTFICHNMGGPIQFKKARKKEIHRLGTVKYNYFY